jgi:hypothetical protein
MIQQPRVRTKTYGDKRFDKTASTFWNNLPSETQNEQSLEIFKKNVVRSTIANEVYSRLVIA